MSLNGCSPDVRKVVEFIVDRTAHGEPLWTSERISVYGSVMPCLLPQDVKSLRRHLRVLGINYGHDRYLMWSLEKSVAGTLARTYPGRRARERVETSFKIVRLSKEERRNKKDAWQRQQGQRLCNLKEAP